MSTLQRVCWHGNTLKGGHQPFKPVAGFQLFFARRLHSIPGVKPKITRLNHVQLCAPIGEEHSAREFYAGVLGLPEIDKPEALKTNGGVWFQIADIQLHIGMESAQGKSKRHPAFEVEDLDAIKNHLKNNGIRIQEEIQIPGCRRFTFYDPFDNRVEFLEKV